VELLFVPVTFPGPMTLIFNKYNVRAEFT
jgi:hypothetical protein